VIEICSELILIRLSLSWVRVKSSMFGSVSARSFPALLPRDSKLSVRETVAECTPLGALL